MERKERRIRISQQQMAILALLSKHKEVNIHSISNAVFRRREYRRPNGRWRADPLTPTERASFSRSLALLKKHELITGHLYNFAITDRGRTEYELRKPPEPQKQEISVNFSAFGKS